MKAAWTWTLALALITAAGPTSAQCSMTGGGGHDHGDRLSRSSQKPWSQKKQQQSIDRLLGDNEGRRLLADALFKDRDFMRGFVARLMTVPEWSALAARHVARDSSGRRTVDPDTRLQPEVLYVCPMHHDVTSHRPGECPKCGMRLERPAPDRN